MWFPHLTVLLVVYTFGPGMLIARPLRLAPGERFCVAIGAGLFACYLSSFVVFAFGMNVVLHAVTTVGCLGAFALTWRDWLAVLRSHQVRRMIWCWLCLLAWGLILTSAVRHYGGGTWGGDWQEHYERTRFLQGGLEYGFKFIKQYDLPMRPPMMNMLSASVLGQVFDYQKLNQTRGFPDYEAFQLVFVFLNSLVVLPCTVLIPRLVKLSPRLARKAPWTLAAVLAASPMFSQNLSYAWTKLFAAFYAILAIAIYLRAWRRGRKGKDEGRRVKDEGAKPEVTPGGPVERAGNRVRILEYSHSVARAYPPRRPFNSRRAFVAAFAVLCVGFLVHFSVGPYGLFLGLHYLFAVWWRRPRKWLEAGWIGGASVAVLSCWFAWSVYHYGAKTTFTSTSAVSDSAKMTAGQNAANVGKNIVNTIVPPILFQTDAVFAQFGASRHSDDPTLADLEQTSEPGKVRDFFFLIYQVSLPGTLGLVGCGLIVWLLWRAWSGGATTEPAVRWFWIAFIPIVYLAGVVVYGGQDRFGVAHICLQPMALIGLCLLAGGVWTFAPRARGVLLVGLLLDFALGVFLQAALQHHLFQIVREWSVADNQEVLRIVEGPDVPSRAAQNNLKEKIDYGMVFWGDRFGGTLLMLEFALGGLLAFLLFKGLLAPRWREVRVVAQVPVAARPTGGKRKRGRQR